MNLPEGFSVFGQRNARELAVLRAENALMRMQVPTDIVLVPEQPKPPTPVHTVCEAVRRVVNGTPLFKGEIVDIVRREYPELKASYCAVDAGLRRLVKDEQMQRIGTRQKFRFTQSISVILFMVALLVGCSSPKFSQPSQLRQSALPPEAGSAHLQWSPWLNMKTYHVHFGLDFNSQTNVLVTVATNCTILGLQPGPYFYAVRASDGRTYTPFYETGRFTVASKIP